MVQQPPPPGVPRPAANTGTNCPRSRVLLRREGPRAHGAELTNIHYPRSHVSPQPTNSFVLLELFSSLQKGTAAAGEGRRPWPSASTRRTSIPSPGTRPRERTVPPAQARLHWLPGAQRHRRPWLRLMTWLYGLYKVNPDNDQQIQTFEKVLGSTSTSGRTRILLPPLINGQRSRPSASAMARRSAGVSSAPPPGVGPAHDLLRLVLNAGYQVRQIAQDGVQFAVENWSDQPLLVASGEYHLRQELQPGAGQPGRLPGPGPAAPGGAGPEAENLVFFGNFGNVAEDIATTFRGRGRRGERLRGGRPDSSYRRADAARRAVNVDLDAAWRRRCSFPPTGRRCPDHPRDIQKTEVSNERVLAFSIMGPGDRRAHNTRHTAQRLLDHQYQYGTGLRQPDDDDRHAEHWAITNDSGPNHPFHIHINPFQVVRNDATTYKKPIWGIALPTGGCNDVDAGPRLQPAGCGLHAAPVSAKARGRSGTASGRRRCRPSSRSAAAARSSRSNS